MLPITISKKYIQNIGWLLFDYGLRMVGGYFVMIWLARFLGPATFGVLSYALANAAIVTAIGVAGLHGVAIKFLVENKDQHNETAGTIFYIRLIASIICYIALAGYLYVEYTSFPPKVLLSLLIGFKVILTPITVIELYFDAIVQSKYRVIARNIGYGVRSVLIVFFILLEWPLILLGFIFLFEEVFGVIGLLFFYKHKAKGKLNKWRFKKDLAKELMSEAWPMVISSAGAILYVKIDQVMIVEMLDDIQGGYYGVAVKISELFSFIPGLLVGTFFPAIIESKKVDIKNYKLKMQKLILLMMSIAAFLGLGIYLFANQIVYYSFGEEFLPAVSIVKIHIWTLILSFLAIVLSRWLIVEKLTKFSLLRHLLGVIANVGLNFLLIPIMGGEGAAIASIISLFCAVILFAVFDKKTFEFLRLLFSSFFVNPFLK